jgi:3-hydroxyisobutyrate dehydrogenase-like beta-hydroxyacid dehydrogenase
MKVAFIGLGQMGSPMARNLLRAGHDVTVYNRSREKAQALAADGGHVADSIADACRDAEVVMTMLADDHATEEIVFGKNGILGALKNGHIHVSHSTISTTLARRLTAEHGHHGQGYLSVPVFGRPEAAEGKKLVVVAAGPTELVDRCRPLFDAIGKVTYVVGSEPWQANAAKVCGNFMIISMVESFSEAFAALRKAGVAPQLFVDVINSLFQSPVYGNYGKMMAAEQFEPAGFALRLGLKDVRLALQVADECTAPMPVASLIRDHMLDALAHGQGDMDWSSIAKVAARRAGL